MSSWPSMFKILSIPEPHCLSSHFTGTFFLSLTHCCFGDLGFIFSSSRMFYSLILVQSYHHSKLLFPSDPVRLCLTPLSPYSTSFCLVSEILCFMSYQLKCIKLQKVVVLSCTQCTASA
jgi:hypothetical protein